MTTLTAPNPSGPTETLRRRARRSGGRWLVHTSESTATAHVDLPLGRSVEARFTEVAGLVDLAEPGAEAVALLIAAHSLEVGPAHRRRRWLGPHVLDADTFPRIALVFDEVARTDDGWTAAGRLHVKRRIADVDATIWLDPGTRRCTITFAADRDAIDLVWAQLAGTVHRPIGRRVEVALALAVSPRAREICRWPPPPCPHRVPPVDAAAEGGAPTSSSSCPCTTRRPTWSPASPACTAT
jgi:polyisoprenoid-binding protein YceI